jgi:magnesium chelatase family protein
MLINIHCAKCIGIDAVPVEIEVDLATGIGIHLVGLADTAIKESLLRTITALQSMGFRIPGRKIVINLAPADMHKNGSGYDVPIALGIIAVSRQREMPSLGDYMIMGELGLDGTIRDIPGALPIVELAIRSGLKGCILPLSSAMEAVEFGNIKIYGVENLEEVLRIAEGGACDDLLAVNRALEMDCERVSGTGYDKVSGTSGKKETNPDRVHPCDYDTMDFSEIIGQEAAKRGLEIAAAGGHHVILIGSPGSGKSSLAKAMVSILPDLSLEESILTSKVYSVAGKSNPGGGLIRKRPFRAPHYSVSMAALLGGGSDNIVPGEVSLASGGVLFMDEFCEAPRRTIEALRAPMEDKRVTISRLKSKVEFPADFMLVAATNPCPCGYYGEGDRCTCSPTKRIAYLGKLSGPIMDRIDLQLFLRPINPKKLVNRPRGESSAAVAARVAAARDIQKKRFAGDGIFCNAAMNNRMIEKYCPLSPDCRELLERILDRMGLSARACSRIIKLARTMADLEGLPDILPEHLSEAAGYRFLDKQNIFD